MFGRVKDAAGARARVRELKEMGADGIKILGIDRDLMGAMADEALGRVRTGFLAELIVVNGNPLENLKVLYSTGVDDIRDGKQTHTGGVEWTIKDGIPYCAPSLAARVKELARK